MTDILYNPIIKEYIGINFLLEKNGIINYDNSTYQKDLNYIDTEIREVINGQSGNFQNYIIDDPDLPEIFQGDYQLLEFKNMCNIENLRILLSNIDFSDKPEDTMLLTTDLFKQKNWYIQNGCKTKVLTIIIFYSESNIDNISFKGIIEHELKHLFDQNTEYKNQAELMNKDIIVAENISNTLLNINQYSEQYHILDIMCQFLYLMNKSEVSARLTQVKNSDLLNSKYTYEQLKRLCMQIINSSTINQQKIINDIIISYDLSDVYHISFKNLDTAYKSNVNKLFKFYLKRIEHFLNQCKKILKFGLYEKDGLLGLCHSNYKYLNEHRYDSNNKIFKYQQIYKYNPKYNTSLF